MIQIRTHNLAAVNDTTLRLFCEGIYIRHFCLKKCSAYDVYVGTRIKRHVLSNRSDAKSNLSGWVFY